MDHAAAGPIRLSKAANRLPYTNEYLGRLSSSSDTARPAQGDVIRIVIDKAPDLEDEEDEDDNDEFVDVEESIPASVEVIGRTESIERPLKTKQDQERSVQHRSMSIAPLSPSPISEEPRRHSRSETVTGATVVKPSEQYTRESLTYKVGRSAIYSDYPKA